MRIHFDDTRRPARLAKLLRAAFAASGVRLGLTGAQDACARLYGYATYHELKAACGRNPASAWDEACPPATVAGRKAWQVASLVADGLPEPEARAFVEGNRPTGASRTRREARPDPAAPAAFGFLAEPSAEAWRKGVFRRNGLCLIVGEAGPDRTATLNAGVRELDRFERKIYVAEDPVEYRIPFVGQVSMGSGVGYGFAQAIRNFMRAEPDVMVLGEIQNSDAAANAVRAAETGHMVLATMDAPGAREAVDRLRGWGVGAASLRLVLRSVLVLCGPDGTGRRGGQCHHFRGPAEVDRFLAGAGAPTPPGDVPPSVIDDAIALMRAGQVTGAALLALFGEAFRKRVEELGLRPGDFGVA